MALESNPIEANIADEEERVQGWQKSQGDRRDILEGREPQNLNIKIAQILGSLLIYKGVEGMGPR